MARKTAVLLLLTLLSLPLPATPHADRIFLNGNIWTGDSARPSAQALAVSGDQLLALGSNRQIRALASPDTAVVDLHGAFVLPGFQDSHLHFPGPSINEVDLTDAATLQEFQRRIAEFAGSHPALPWIVGNGWGYALFPAQKPDKKYLDAVVADRPVYVGERDGHMGLANSKALARAGITRNTPDPPTAASCVSRMGSLPANSRKPPSACSPAIFLHPPTRIATSPCSSTWMKPLPTG